MNRKEEDKSVSTTDLPEHLHLRCGWHIKQGDEFVPCLRSTYMVAFGTDESMELYWFPVCVDHMHEGVRFNWTVARPFHLVRQNVEDLANDDTDSA